MLFNSRHMKKLGQHFLKNNSVLKKIVDALELKSGDVVVEIGAGHGELTDEIQRQATHSASSGQASDPPSLKLRRAGKQQGVKILAVEKDKDLAELLRKKFAANENIRIVEDDALKIIPQLVSNWKLKTGNWKLIGNVPYYITGRLLRVIGELGNKPELCVLMLQKEVAERIAATPPRMNKLAASVQFWAKPEITMNVPRGNFSPPPEVDSAVIKLAIRDTEHRAQNMEHKTYEMEKYYMAVRRLFAQPRKTILNNLATSDGGQARSGDKQGAKIKIAEILRALGLNPEDRPQNLTVEDIKKIDDFLN